MSWLRKILGMSAGSGSRDPGDDFWYRAAPHETSSGTYIVTPETALRLPAAVDALNAITQPLAHLPLKVFRRLAGDAKAAAPQHPAAQVLRSPAVGWTPYEWRGFMQWNLALHNNAYAEMIPGPRGAVDQMVPLHPALTRPERRGDRVWFQVTDPVTGQQRWLRDDQVWHLKQLPMAPDGVCGISRVITNRDTIAHALAVQEYGARFFANDGQAGGFIELTSDFKDDESRENFKRAFREARTGRKAHGIAVLKPGMSFKAGPERNNDHAQFLETRKEMAIELARIWNVPPHKIRSLDKATFSNIEQQSLEFVTDTLLPWLTLWEQKIKAEIIDPLTLDGEDYFAEFNVAGLLRGDLKSRYEAYAMGRNWGWLSVNDIRRLENMDPLQDGDIYLQPLNMQEAGAPGSVPPAQQATTTTPRLVAGGDD